MPTKKPRIIVTVSDSMNDEIKQYQKDNNFKTKNSAVIDLVMKGMEYLAESGLLPETKKAPPISGEALTIARKYDDLSRRDRNIVNGLVDLMLGSKREKVVQLTDIAARNRRDDDLSPSVDYANDVIHPDEPDL